MPSAVLWPNPVRFVAHDRAAHSSGAPAAAASKDGRLARRPRRLPLQAASMRAKPFGIWYTRAAGLFRLSVVSPTNRGADFHEPAECSRASQRRFPSSPDLGLLVAKRKNSALQS